MSGVLSSISEYKALEARLSAEIEGNQDESTIRVLGKRLDALHAQIVASGPADNAEALAKIHFFLDLASQWMEQTRDLEIARDLICDRLGCGTFEDIEGRVSIIDSSFRYVSTTRGNKRFYQVENNRIIGAYVAEVIGEGRFNGRAKRFLEKAFLGTRVEYYHLLDSAIGQRIMKCIMEPRRGEAAGAIVTMHDVTDELKNASSIELVALKPAAA